MLKTVIQCFEDGHYGDAIHQGILLLRRDPVVLGDADRRRVHEVLGRSYLKLGNTAEALEHLLRALGREQFRDRAFLADLGAASQACGKPHCAATCFDMAAARGSPHAVEGRRNRPPLPQQAADPSDVAYAEAFLRLSTIRSKVTFSTIADHVHNTESNNHARLVNRDSVHTARRSYLHILRGHSSYTPILEGSGGGYFLVHQGKGCVVDPGYGFVRNFLHAGYGFGNIHAIVVTHGHDDHMADLPAICSILNKAEFPSKVSLYLDATAYAALRGHYLLASGGISFRGILRPGSRSIPLFGEADQTLVMDIYKAKHRVPILNCGLPRGVRKGRTCQFRNGVGVGVRLLFQDQEPRYVLFPSDTGWDDKIAAQYQSLAGQVDVALLHVSSIKPCERNWLRPRAEKKDYLYPQHLGLIGTVEFVNRIQPEFVLLGERGAELEDVWAKLAEVIRVACAHKHIYATDIGTRVVFDAKGMSVTHHRRHDVQANEQDRSQ